MKRKVRLTHTVEMIVDGPTIEDIEKWLDTTTPDKAKKLANSSACIFEDYTEDIFYEVDEDTMADFTIPPEEVVARYEYEHNDGDQIWTDCITFIKRGSEYFKTKYDGYYCKEYTEPTCYESLVGEMAEIRRKVEKERQWNIRGGHTITKDLI